MANTETRDIICPTCGGRGCNDCDETGVITIESAPRADGLPWHPHAVEGPTNIVAPPPSVRRRRGSGAELPPAPVVPALDDTDDNAALERDRLERENERQREELAELRAKLAASSSTASA